VDNTLLVTVLTRPPQHDADAQHQGGSDMAWHGRMLVVCVVCALAESAFAITIHVPENYSTIQGAIDAASDGDLILVGPGTYEERIDYLGKWLVIRSTDGPDVTTIDGGGEEECYKALEEWSAQGGIGPLPQCRTIVCDKEEPIGTELSGFTIVGGVDVVEPPSQVLIVNSALTISNCVFAGSRTYNGPALDADGSILALYNCTTADSAYPLYAWLSLTDSTALLAGCHFTNYDSSESPMVSARYSALLVEQCRFTRCTGGAVFARGCNISVSDSTFERSYNESGGGMSLYDTSIEMINCIIDDNSAQSGGGIDLYYASDARFENCVFSNNRTVASSGGAVWVSATTDAMFENCLFAGNLCRFSGGAVACLSGSGTTFLNCTFTENLCGWDQQVPPGSYTGGAVTGEANVVNCIAYNNYTTKPDGISLGIDHFDAADVTYTR
jgi:hypothetical protein